MKNDELLKSEFLKCVLGNNLQDYLRTEKSEKIKKII